MRSTPQRFCIVLMLVTMMAVPFAMISASRADARPPQYQFNLLGWGQDSGNHGHLYSADFMWQQMVVLHDVYGFDWPNITTTNETCWDWRSQYFNNTQFTALLYRLSYVTGGSVVYGWYHNGQNDAKAACQFNGIGVIARSNYSPDFSAKWASDFQTELAPTLPICSGSNQPCTNHRRFIKCIFPALGFVNYMACVTHLDNNHDGAVQQQIDAKNYFGYLGGGTPVEAIGGDYNLDSSEIAMWNWYASYGEASDGAYTHKSTTPTRKIDYFWYSGYVRQSYGGRLRPPQCSGAQCVDYQDPSMTRLSDHYMVRGDYW